MRKLTMRIKAIYQIASELGAIALGLLAILVAIRYGDVQISQYASAVAGAVLVIIGLRPLVETRAKALWPKFPNPRLGKIAEIEVKK